jgi:hypothetical protein
LLSYPELRLDKPLKAEEALTRLEKALKKNVCQAVPPGRRTAFVAQGKGAEIFQKSGAYKDAVRLEGQVKALKQDIKSSRAEEKKYREYDKCIKLVEKQLEQLRDGDRPQGK